MYIFINTPRSSGRRSSRWPRGPCRQGWTTCAWTSEPLLFCLIPRCRCYYDNCYIIVNSVNNNYYYMGWTTCAWASERDKQINDP